MSKSIKILISVEGQTEERFVKNVLNPYLNQEKSNVCAIPVILDPHEQHSLYRSRGGILPYNKTKKEILTLLRDSSATIITTMYDYYGLPDDFPGYLRDPKKDIYEKANTIEQELSNDIKSTKFIPYLQLHEFEALLFTSPEEIVSACLDRKNSAFKRTEDILKKIKSNFSNPEKINDDPTKHPSQRIKTNIPNYNKILNGIKIASVIGIPHIRSNCPHFNDWIAQMLS